MSEFHCIWCGQKRPDTIQEMMNDKPCPSPDGDGHLYSIEVSAEKSFYSESPRPVGGLTQRAADVSTRR